MIITEELHTELKRTRIKLNAIPLEHLRAGRSAFEEKLNIGEEEKKLFMKLYDDVERERTRWGDVS